MRHRTGSLTLLLLLLAHPPAGMAQEPDRTPPDTLEARFARAQAIRDTLTQPPGEPVTSGQDVVRLPFQLAGVVGLLVYEAGSWLLDRARDVGFDDDIGDLVGAGPPPGEAAAPEAGAAPPRGLDVDVGSFSYRSWPAVSLRYDIPPFFVEGGLSVRLYQRHRAGLELGDSVRGAGLVATYATRREPDFWGIGPETTEATRSDYAWDRVELELDARRPVGDAVRVRGELALEQNEVGRGHDDGRPDLHDVFAGGLPYGALERTRFVRAGAGASVDWTDVDGFQRKGVWLDGAYHLFEGVGGTDSRFHRLRADLRGYVPLNDRQDLMVRGLAESLLGESGSGAPFTHLVELGDEDGLRGFRSRRFRDRNLLAVMAEWRYEVYWTPGFPEVRVEGFVFADHGTVFDDYSALGDATFQTTPGIGLRLVRGPDVKASAFVAFNGDPATRFQVELGAAF